MTDLYGSNYTKAYVNKPSEKAGTGEYNGHVKILFDEYVVPTANELATADFIYLGKLPKGARVLGGKVKTDAAGATGIFDIGYLANGVDAADADAFAASVDPGAAAVLQELNGVAIGKKFEAETTVLIDVTEVTADAGGDRIQVWIEYVVD